MMHRGEVLLDDHAMNALADFGFAVGLKAFELGAELLRKLLERRVDLGQRRRAIHAGLALAEHVQVDPVEDEDAHRIH